MREEKRKKKKKAKAPFSPRIIFLSLRMARTTSAEKLEEEKGTRAAMSKRESSIQSPMAGTKTQAQETLGEALVFAMLCIVGLPVEVQVKDGSVYSGIFHSANLSHGLCFFSNLNSSFLIVVA